MKKKLLALGFCLAAAASVGYAADGDKTGIMVPADQMDWKEFGPGSPVKVVDQCQRETVGRTLTFNKGADTIVVDGNSQIRTQTKGGNGKCS